MEVIDGLSTIWKSHSVRGRYYFGHTFNAYRSKLTTFIMKWQQSTTWIFPLKQSTCPHILQILPHILQIWPVVFIWALCIQHTGKHTELPEPSSISVNHCLFCKYYWPQLKGAFLCFWSPLQMQRTEQHVARKSCIHQEVMKTSAWRVSRKGSSSTTTIYTTVLLYIFRKCNFHPSILSQKPRNSMSTCFKRTHGLCTSPSSHVTACRN